MDNITSPIKNIYKDGLYIGVDGCRGGWIAAVMDHGEMRLERYDTITEIIGNYPVYDSFLVDMVIGLRNSSKQIRPDDLARKELGSRASTIFPVPSRAAVYADGEGAQKKANQLTLGKSLSKQTSYIIPKIKEIDIFLSANPKYKNKILESHPELDFARLSGSVLLSRKKHADGMNDRIAILSNYLPNNPLDKLKETAKKLKCNADDLVDAICLVVTASLASHGQCETIPANPERDETGLFMMLTVPKKSLE